MTNGASIAARVRALEQQSLAWTAEASAVDEDTAIRDEADIVRYLAEQQGVAFTGSGEPPVDAYKYMSWVLDGLGAPTELPGLNGHVIVGISLAERIAALFGMTVKEYDQMLEELANG